MSFSSLNLKAFTCREEVERYLGGESIECFICGGNYKSLSRHLPFHEVDVDEYKKALAIPVTWALDCAPTRHQRESSQSEKWERLGAPDGWAPPGFQNQRAPRLAPRWKRDEFEQQRISRLPQRRYMTAEDLGLFPDNY